MKLTTTLFAAALALIAPAAVQAQESGQSGYSPYPYYPAPYPEGPRPQQPSYTQVRVLPPQPGVVFIYDGPRLIGRFDREDWLTVSTGRAYGVIAMRGPLFLWSGFVSATGPTIHLTWGEQPQPSWGYGPPPVLDHHEYVALLYAMDRRYDDRDKLRVLEGEAHRRAFTTAQVDQILPRFRSERYRLHALTTVRHRLVDPENRYGLMRHFWREGARRRASEVLR